MATLKYKDPNTGEVKTVITSIVAEMDQGSALPEVSSADNGKILRVINGQWQAALLPIAEEMGF